MFSLEQERKCFIEEYTVSYFIVVLGLQESSQSSAITFILNERTEFSILIQSIIFIRSIFVNLPRLRRKKYTVNLYI